MKKLISVFFENVPGNHTNEIMGKIYIGKPTYLLIFLFSLFVVNALADNTPAKAIVVVLDNSKSMIDANVEIDQCTTSNYALQLLVSTLNIGDSLHIVLSQKPNSPVVFFQFGMNDKQKVIESVGGYGCYNAYMVKPLLKGMDIFNKIKNNNKQLILIGDGMWFSDKDRPTEGFEQLTDHLSQIAAKYQLWYINTANNAHKNNGFYNTVLQKDERLKKVNVLETNDSVLLLMDKIEVIVKSLLNLPENDFNDYELMDGNIVINSKIPLAKIFIIDQYIGENQERIGAVQSNMNNLKVLDRSELKKNNLKANFYVIGNDNGFISEDEIKIPISGEFSDKRKLKIYAIHTFGSASVGINVIGDKVDTICKYDENVELFYKIEQKNGDPLSKNQIDLLEVIAISTADTTIKHELMYDGKKQRFTGIVGLDTTRYEEKFRISAKTPNYFSEEVELTITKQICRRNIETSFSWGIYTVCNNDKEVDLICWIKQKNGEPLTENQIGNIRVTATSKTDSHELGHDNSNRCYTHTINLNAIGSNEVFQISVEIPNYSTLRKEIEITERTCLKVKLENNYYDTLSFSMLLDTADVLGWNIRPPIITNLNTGETLNGEFGQMIIESDIKPPYSLVKTDDGLMLKMDNKRGFFTPCLMSSNNDAISFAFEHPKADAPSNYHITIVKTDTGVWERCYRVLIVLILCILFLIYLYAIITKHRFKEKAIINLYDYTPDGKDYVAYRPLKTRFFNRYLNPFEKHEKNRVYGMDFRATRRTTIFLLGTSITSSLKQNIYGADFTKDSSKKGNSYHDYLMRNGDFVVKLDKNGDIKSYYEYKV